MNICEHWTSVKLCKDQRNSGKLGEYQRTFAKLQQTEWNVSNMKRLQATCAEDARRCAGHLRHPRCGAGPPAALACGCARAYVYVCYGICCVVLCSVALRCVPFRSFWWAAAHVWEQKPNFSHYASRHWQGVRVSWTRNSQGDSHVRAPAPSCREFTRSPCAAGHTYVHTHNKHAVRGMSFHAYSMYVEFFVKAWNFSNQYTWHFVTLVSLINIEVIINVEVDQFLKINKRRDPNKHRGAKMVL